MKKEIYKDGKKGRVGGGTTFYVGQFRIAAIRRCPTLHDSFPLVITRKHVDGHSFSSKKNKKKNGVTRHDSRAGSLALRLSGSLVCLAQENDALLCLVKKQRSNRWVCESSGV